MLALALDKNSAQKLEIEWEWDLMLDQRLD